VILAAEVLGVFPEEPAKVRKVSLTADDAVEIFDAFIAKVKVVGEELDGICKRIFGRRGKSGLSESLQKNMSLLLEFSRRKHQ
jgi:hypothetical protein